MDFENFHLIDTRSCSNAVQQSDELLIIKPILGDVEVFKTGEVAGWHYEFLDQILTSELLSLLWFDFLQHKICQD